MQECGDQASRVRVPGAGGIDAREAVVGVRSARALARAIDGLREAWLDDDEAEEFSQLEEEAADTLLEQRCFRVLEVFGARHIVAHLATNTAAAPWPVYLGESARPLLPMLRVFDARLLVELRPRQLASEASPVAGLVLAITREAL